VWGSTDAVGEARRCSTATSAGGIAYVGRTPLPYHDTSRASVVSAIVRSPSLTRM
jgi:hypothetical protein